MGRIKPFGQECLSMEQAKRQAETNVKPRGPGTQPSQRSKNPSQVYLFGEHGVIAFRAQWRQEEKVGDKCRITWPEQQSVLETR